MGLFRKPKPVAVAWVWDGEHWLRHASYDTPPGDYFTHLMEQWAGCQFLSLTTGEGGYPVLCLDGRAGS
jgi:hypothetical protein